MIFFYEEDRSVSRKVIPIFETSARKHGHNEKKLSKKVKKPKIQVVTLKSTIIIRRIDTMNKSE